MSGHNKDSTVVEEEEEEEEQSSSSDCDDTNFHDNDADDANCILESGAVCVDRLMTVSSNSNQSDRWLLERWKLVWCTLVVVQI